MAEHPLRLVPDREGLEGRAPTPPDQSFSGQLAHHTQHLDDARSGPPLIWENRSMAARIEILPPARVVNPCSPRSNYSWLEEEVKHPLYLVVYQFE